ncbi:MAG TPA: NADH-quinone oxidoreductase subunit K [Candidatus Omnitrophota bacterium]|nr:NADH-quinone oxidoreductase subunit K [Candidatus Omnitrophota bacterium]HPT38980.1 NADH-quinone oxidoreductase subunit K [Candidatus Omnitrophota bacterium]
MSQSALQLFCTFGIFIILLLITGAYCMFVSFNLIRVLIGFEILIKAVTLLIICAGYVCGRTALAQAIVITLIVIEIVVMVVAGGVALWAYRHNKTIDPRKLSNLKG